MASTTAVCRSCGTVPHEGARFCEACGTPLVAAPDHAEYKQVTVLFADVVRSMAMAAALDVERLRDIMTEVVERAATVVRRYGGTVEHTGDGVMALFGAPVALEDHAFRACLAALDIQSEAADLAREVARRDGLELRLRVGLNSGKVIAGEFGSGMLGYTATGESVGFAQRMESVAPPGGVMLSESTAALVEHRVALADPEWVRIKNADAPVRVRRLLGTGQRSGLVGRAEAQLVGRRWEMAVLDAMVDRAIGGRGGVVGVTGPPGIGKSRVAREAAAIAAARGVDVFWTFCESHTVDIPFFAVTRLLRADNGIDDLDDATARTRIRAAMPDSDPEDLLLLDDLLGIGDPNVAPPQIDPDARRRRLTALNKTGWLAHTRPALYIVEDAHWIDSVSESMLADFFAMSTRVPTMVLITSRPEYQGTLSHLPGAQTVALAPLDDSNTSELLDELLGGHPSVRGLVALIADRAAGNPFFTEEIVRELVQRGVLHGDRGDYICTVDVADVSVPATVQAAIEARIDRLSAPAKLTLNAASVVGARFDAELLTALEIDPAVDELLDTEMIDQVRFIPTAEYAFHHPLIRAVAYESQLKSARAEWHRRLASAIREREPASVNENAALIADHLSAAGDLRAAYKWHMRAAGWSANRDLGAARWNWDRARQIADSLPDDDPAHLSMRIAPRTMQCATGWRIDKNIAAHFDELAQLCARSEDNASLAIGMAGLIGSHLVHGRVREASRLASHHMALLESSGDPTPMLGLAFIVFANWFDAGEFGEIMRWSQAVIELADGDPTMGAGFGVASPLAMALVWRGVARWWLNRPGWRQDLRDAVAAAENANAANTVGVLNWSYGLGILYGLFRADDAIVSAMERAVQTTEESGDDFMFGVAKYTLGIALLDADDDADRDRGLALMTAAREVFLRVDAPFLIPMVEICGARERARRGALDAAIDTMRVAVDGLHEAGRIGYGVWATSVLVDALLARGTPADLAEAGKNIDWLANASPTGGSPAMELMTVRLRALLGRADGDTAAFRTHADRYRALAHLLGFEAHERWADALTEQEV
ncbi:MAG TPA: adenylate/guanylate cyclase domain-containing protein [Mycobacterium sp.]|nr:adenylate/guanylate cyclase domain-containing protein [Mycobacterium sp.]